MPFSRLSFSAILAGAALGAAAGAEECSGPTPLAKYESIRSQCEYNSHANLDKAMGERVGVDALCEGIYQKIRDVAGDYRARYQSACTQTNTILSQCGAPGGQAGGLSCGAEVYHKAKMAQRSLIDLLAKDRDEIDALKKAAVEAMQKYQADGQKIVIAQGQASIAASSLRGTSFLLAAAGNKEQAASLEQKAAGFEKAINE
jgi:hypothetical protein